VVQPSQLVMFGLDQIELLHCCCQQMRSCPSISGAGSQKGMVHRAMGTWVLVTFGLKDSRA
jgi:hypothetical protein